MRYEPNEVTINEEGTIEDYGEYAEALLAVRLSVSRTFSAGLILTAMQDDAMLFITVRSASPADVPRVLQVVEHIRRLRHKRGKSPHHPFPHHTRSPIPSVHRSKRRRATRRAEPIRRLRRPTTRSATYQARRPPRKRIHAPDKPDCTPKQDPHARTVPATRAA